MILEKFPSSFWVVDAGGLEAASGPWGGLVGGGVAGKCGAARGFSVSGSLVHHHPPLSQWGPGVSALPQQTSERTVEAEAREGKRGKLRRGKVVARGGGDGWAERRLALVMAGACSPHPFLGSGEFDTQW